MLTLPALMIMGMPAEIANATNRVGIILQSAAGTRGFYLRGKLAPSDVLPTLLPSLLGSLVGALLASYLPREVLKPALLVVMLGMALLMLIKPSTITPLQVLRFCNSRMCLPHGWACFVPASMAALCRPVLALSFSQHLPGVCAMTW